jgi:uncharacterized protein (DUF736 family)
MAEQKTDWTERELGALWTKTSNGGDKYMTGHVEIDGVKHDLILFPNKHKGDNEKAPSLRVYRDTPRDGTAQASSKPAPKKQVEDDIPF